MVLVGIVPSSLTLYTTRDSGLNWAETSIPSKGLPRSIVGLSFISPEQGWVVAAVPNHRFQVYHFQSGTWTALKTPYSSVQNPTVDLVSSQVAYLNQPMGWASLWKTVDGGLHWTPVSFPTNYALVNSSIVHASYDTIPRDPFQVLALPFPRPLKSARDSDNKWIPNTKVVS